MNWTECRRTRLHKQERRFCDDVSGRVLGIAASATPLHGFLAIAEAGDTVHVFELREDRFKPWCELRGFAFDPLFGKGGWGGAWMAFSDTHPQLLVVSDVGNDLVHIYDVGASIGTSTRVGYVFDPDESAILGPRGVAAHSDCVALSAWMGYQNTDAAVYVFRSDDASWRTYWTLQQSIALPGSRPCGMRFSGSGSFLVVGDTNGVCTFQLSDGHMVRQVFTDGGVYDVEQRGREWLIVTLSGLSCLTEHGECKKIPVPVTASCLAFMPGAGLAVVDRTHCIRFLNVMSPERVQWMAAVARSRFRSERPSNATWP